MANQQYLNLLKQGVAIWNQWRQEHAEIWPSLQGADLSNANLNRADLSDANLELANLSNASLVEADLIDARLLSANLKGANFSEANLTKANLQEAHLNEAQLMWASLMEADLRKADLSGANLTRANLTRSSLSKTNLSNANLSNANLSHTYLREANLSGANLCGADLSGATLDNVNLVKAILKKARIVQAYLNGSDLREADLSGANLNRAVLIETILTKANLTDCLVYGISAWDVHLDGATQLNLVITHTDQPIVMVDNIEIAQFIYLLLNNQKIREAIDSITSKVVLILGRFTPERKTVLDAIRDELRKQNYTPVLFDFEKPTNRDLTGTVSILAHLARFIIVDLTDPSSAPHEVAIIAPQTIVPVQPLLLQEPLLVDGTAGHRREYAMFEDLRRRHHWILPTFLYRDTAELLASLQTHVIAPAEQMAGELIQPK